MQRTIIKQRLAAFGSAVVMSCFGFTGLASADTSVITNTGPDSTNIIVAVEFDACTITNLNDVAANSTNDQTAVTGDAKVSDNTTGGSAASGTAANSNSDIISVIIGNNTGMPPLLSNPITNADPCAVIPAGGQGSGVINTTGPNSFNGIGFGHFNNSFKSNNNFIRFGGEEQGGNTQSARSGSALTQGNTGGGSAGSGQASNTNTGGAAATITNSPAGGSGVSSPAPAASVNSISNTGPDSTNLIIHINSDESFVSNSNNISGSSSNNQSASSGTAAVTDNTTAGSATTGTAANWNSATETVHISN